LADELSPVLRAAKLRLELAGVKQCLPFLIHSGAAVIGTAFGSPYGVFRQTRDICLGRHQFGAIRDCVDRGVSSPAHHAPLPASGSETEPMETATSRKVSALIAAVLTLPILGSTAIAETSEERQACMGDAFRVCWAAIPNRNEVFRCLMDNRPRLNPACRVVMDQYRRPHRVTRHSRTTARVE